MKQYNERCLPKDSPGTPDTISVDHRRWMDLFTIDLINDIGLSAKLKLLKKGDDVFEVQNAEGRTYQCHFQESLWKGLEVHTPFA